MCETDRNVSLAATARPAQRETIMLDTNPQPCDVCKRGHVTWHDRRLAFRKWTDRGYVSCRVTIPLGVCDRCQSRHWKEDAEAVVEGAVRREYDKLLPVA